MRRVQACKSAYALLFVPSTENFTIEASDPKYGVDRHALGQKNMTKTKLGMFQVGTAAMRLKKSRRIKESSVSYLVKFLFYILPKLSTWHELEIFDAVYEVCRRRFSDYQRGRSFSPAGCRLANMTGTG